MLVSAAVLCFMNVAVLLASNGDHPNSTERDFAGGTNGGPMDNVEMKSPGLFNGGNLNETMFRAPLRHLVQPLKMEECFESHLCSRT